MIDIGSSTNILYFDVFQKLRLTTNDLTPMISLLTGFTGDSIPHLGIMSLYVTFGGEPYLKIIKAKFMVVNIPSVYNVIIGQPTLNRLQAIISIYHTIMKFSTNTKVDKLSSNPREFRLCYLMIVSLFKKV